MPIVLSVWIRYAAAMTDESPNDTPVVANGRNAVCAVEIPTPLAVLLTEYRLIISALLYVTSMRGGTRGGEINSVRFGVPSDCQSTAEFAPELKDPLKNLAFILPEALPTTR